MKFRILLIVMLFFVFNNVQATENKIDGSVQSELSLFLCPNDNIKIYYDEETEGIPKTISNYLEKVPAEMKLGTKQIILLSYKNENVAGVAKDETIYLYDFNSYSTSTQKYIIYHEVAHNWGNYLMQQKILDYSYTEYSEVVKKDNNYITDYSKSYIKEKGRYSEDFADAVGGRGMVVHCPVLHGNDTFRADIQPGLLADLLDGVAANRDVNITPAAGQGPSAILFLHQ